MAELIQFAAFVRIRNIYVYGAPTCRSRPDSRMTATVTRLSGTVYYTDLNTVGLLRRPFLRQTAFANVKYNSIFRSRSLPQTIVESVIS